MTFWPLTPTALTTAAVKVAKLDDFGEDSFREGLSVVCDSLARDVDLSVVGRLAFRDRALNALVTRLRRVDLAKRRPDIAEMSLEPPIIVIGLPRSGTTWLHRLLAQGDDARPIPMWELQQPIPGHEGRDKRREEVASRLKLLKKSAPMMDAKHFLHPDQPEECMLLLDETFVSLSYWVNSPVLSYLDWFIQQDQVGPYQIYRWHLQHLQSISDEGRRLVLKAPVHTGCLDALLRAVPEAHVVQTHRDPEPVVGSIASLFHTLHSLSTRTRDHEQSSRKILELLSAWMERNLVDRRRYPDKVVDVEYRDLLANPIGVVERIYDHCGLTLSMSFRTRLEELVANRPQHKYGKHEYSLAEAGLSAGEVERAFAAYQQWRREVTLPSVTAQPAET